MRRDKGDERRATKRRTRDRGKPLALITYCTLLRRNLGLQYSIFRGAQKADIPDRL
jgi:hypothetical protein